MSAKTTSFTQEHKDDDGVIQTGTFTAKRLSIMDRSRVSVRRNQLSGGMYCVRDDNGNPTGQGLDPETDFINGVIAHLETALIQKPIWFKLEEITDTGLLMEVYDKVIDFERSFFRSGDQPAAEGSHNDRGGETSSDQAPPQQGHPATAQKVVGQQVQTSLDA